MAAIIAPILFLYVWTHDSVTSAVKAGDHERLAALIKHGKDVNFRSKLTFVDWREGYTPLHWAAAQRDAFAVEMLLRAGADPKAITPRGHVTPLHAMFLPIGGGSGSDVPPDPVRCIELLTQAGVDVNARLENGDTALATVVQEWNAELAGVLIRCGADPYQWIIAEDYPPMMYVIMNDKERMFQAFVENGFDLDRPLTERGGSTRSVIRRRNDMPRVKEYLAALEKGDGGGGGGDR